MVVATTRERSAPAEMFSGLRGPALDFANIVVSIPPDRVRQIGEVQWPRQIPGDPATEFVTLKANYIDRPQAIATFSRLVKNAPKRQVLVFVHGFNNRFEDAVFRFAQFVHDSGADVAPVLFSWPSNGSSFAYDYDRESANYSRDALEDLLRLLSKNPQVGEVTVLAHSMGNWVTLEALRQMAIRDGKVADKIRNVLLAAPDLDFDVAREDITAMGPQRPHFTLFVSDGKIRGGPTTGTIDPDIEPYKSALAGARIDVVNPTGVSSADQTYHGTFAENSRVVEVIASLIAMGGLDERIMATTVSAAVGNAASLAVSIWQFLKDQGAILGSIAAIVSIAGAIWKFAGGIWKFAGFVAKKSEKDSSASSVKADHGGVAAGRDINGPINTNTRDDSKS
jgi:esterase/lipase superfamily enzyme